ncbi:MAG: DUF2341 domain-containing protein [Thermodesulfobacteriota bacterium]
MPDLSEFKKYKLITLDTDAYLSSDEDNVVVPFIISPGDDFWTFEDGNGNYVRYTIDGEVTELEFHTESYDNVAEKAVWWIKIPSALAASNTLYRIYFKATSPSDGADREGTFPTPIKSAYHMNENQPTVRSKTFEVDSAAGQADATNSGTTTRSVYSEGRNYDGVNDGLRFGNGTHAALLHGAAGITVRFLMEVDSLDTVNQLLYRMGITTNVDGLSIIIKANSDLIRIAGRSQAADGLKTATSSATVSTGVLYHLVGIADYADSSFTVYLSDLNSDTSAVKIIDAVSASFGSSTFVDSNDQTLDDEFGATSGSAPFDGGGDELMVIGEAWTDNRVEADFQALRGDWQSVGATQSLPQLSGLIAASSTCSGSMSITKNLAGVVTCLSVVNGALTVDRVFEGTIEGALELTGSLDLNKTFVGTVSSLSELSGLLGLDTSIVGTIAGVSTVSGILSFTHQIIISAERHIFIIDTERRIFKLPKM